MAKRGHGKIVNIASIVGVVCTPFAGAYCSSKAAVISVSDAMRNELRPFGIDVITARNTPPFCYLAPQQSCSSPRDATLSADRPRAGTAWGGEKPDRRQ